MSKLNLTKNFTLFLIEEAKPLIASGKATYQDIILKFKSKFGRDPEGMEAIAIRQEFAKPESNVIQMPMKRSFGEEIQSMEGKNRKATVEELDEYAEKLGDADYEFGVVRGDETIAELEKKLIDQKAYEAEMYDQYKTGKLDPKPGDNTPARRKFLQRQAEDAESSGDSRLFNLDEAEELEGLESLEKPIAEATAGRINYSKMAEMFPDVKLYGDESFDELLIIEKTGKHPRNKADGGRIGYAIGGLSEQGQNIYDSMTRAGFDEMAIAQALDEQQVAPEIITPGLQQEAVAPPRIQPILPINQGDSSGITTNINRSNPNFDYEFAALGNLANPNNVALTEEEQKTLNFQKGKDGLMSFAKGLGYAINPLGFFAKKGYDFYQNKVRDAQYQKDEADRMKKFQEEKAEQEILDAAYKAQTKIQREAGGSGGGQFDGASSKAEYDSDPTSFSGSFAKGGLATMFVRKR